MKVELLFIISSCIIVALSRLDLSDHLVYITTI